MPAPISQQPIQREVAVSENLEGVQRKSIAAEITPLVQREISDEKVEEVQAKGADEGSFETSGNKENQLSASKGGGSPLSGEIRRFMEPRFGADFSSVRVHTDGAAGKMNQELGAQAFAHGSDVYFGEGKSPGNNELMAHEITPLVQQTGVVQQQSIKETESCQHTPILKVISYIHQEMIKNVAGADVAYIRDKMGFWQWDNLIFFKGPVDIVQAYWRWYNLVKTGGPWDHKAKIMNSYGEWSFDRLDKRLYYFDIWSNIHYGYIGRSPDIPEWDLLSGGGIAQQLARRVPPGYEDRVQTMLDFFSALDDPFDQEAIKIGFELWRSVKTGVTVQNILDAARTHAANLATEPCR